MHIAYLIETHLANVDIKSSAVVWSSSIDFDIRIVWDALIRLCVIRCAQAKISVTQNKHAIYFQLGLNVLQIIYP